MYLEKKHNVLDKPETNQVEYMCCRYKELHKRHVVSFS